MSNFDEFKKEMEKMALKEYNSFVKAVLSIIAECDNKELLDEVYNDYMENDGLSSFLNDEIYEKLTEQHIGEKDLFDFA